MSTLLERAKQVAEYKHLSMVQFQESLGVSISHFYNAKDISLKTLRAIEEIYPDINTRWLQTGEGYMTNDDKLKSEEKFYKVPLLPIAAQGGTPDNIESQIQQHECEMIVSPIDNITMAIPVTGDSMSPEFPSGSKVFVQKVNEKAFIEWGCTYVLDTVNGAVIKNVFQTKGDETKVTCRSVNPNFADFTVDLTDIRGWYRVRGCFTIK